MKKKRIVIPIILIILLLIYIFSDPFFTYQMRLSDYRVSEISYIGIDPIENELDPKELTNLILTTNSKRKLIIPFTGAEQLIRVSISYDNGADKTFWIHSENEIRTRYFIYVYESPLFDIDEILGM